MFDTISVSIEQLGDTEPPVDVNQAVSDAELFAALVARREKFQPPVRRFWSGDYTAVAEGRRALLARPEFEAQDDSRETSFAVQLTVTTGAKQPPERRVFYWRLHPGEDVAAAWARLGHEVFGPLEVVLCGNDGGGCWSPGSPVGRYGR